MPCKNQPCRRGSAPYDALIGPAAFGDVQKNGLFKNDARAARPLSSLLQLSGAPELLRAQTRARLTWKPARWTLPTKPTIGGGLRLCQSRNGATNSTIAEESFPDDVTQPSQVSTQEQPKEPELNTWRPKQRTPAGKRTNFEPALNPYKQVQTEFLILTELVKIWSECSNEAKVRSWSFGWLVKLWNRKECYSWNLNQNSRICVHVYALLNNPFMLE